METLSLTVDSTPSDVKSWLNVNGFSENVQKAFEENEVDGCAMFCLTDDDIRSMLPGKIGPARKIIMLITELKMKNQATCENVATAAASSPDKSLDISVTQSTVAHFGLPTFSDHTVQMKNQATCENVATAAASSPDKSLDISVTQSTVAHFGLPTFSGRIKEQLEKGDVKSDMNRLVEECAYFIIGNGDMKDRGSYEEFGRQMHTMYPCIGHPGTQPWRYFCRKLSQKVRHIRWNRNRKSVTPKGETQNKRRRIVDSASASNDTNMSAEDCKNKSNVVLVDHMRLKEEWSKSTVSSVDGPNELLFAFTVNPDVEKSSSMACMLRELSGLLVQASTTSEMSDKTSSGASDRLLNC